MEKESLTRRSFLKAGAAAAATAAAFGAIPGCSDKGSSPEGGEGANTTGGGKLGPIIDVHHHALEDWMIAVAKKAGMPAASWTVEADIEAMDQAGITASILSFPTPAPRDNATVRTSNEFMAQLVADHPSRYGFFAGLNYDDVDNALAEIEYSAGTLKADGFVLFGNYKGIYLSDDRIDAVLAELDSRGAAVLVHPGPPAGEVAFPRDPAIYEFPFETTRAIAELVYAGKVKKYPNIKWILSHAGGTLPFIAHRLGNGKEIGGCEQTPEEILPDFASMYFEFAHSISPCSIPATKALAGVDHMLFGSDLPMRTMEGLLRSVEDLKANVSLTIDEQNRLASGTALELFPRFKEVL
ncbi:MAG: amidohydrolase [Eggerthellaceae bacterium]|nr:amidohydrolase [Eggerthellaceae bacterium]